MGDDQSDVDTLGLEGRRGGWEDKRETDERTDKWMDRPTEWMGAKKKGWGGAALQLPTRAHCSWKGVQSGEAPLCIEGHTTSASPTPGGRSLEAAEVTDALAHPQASLMKHACLSNTSHSDTRHETRREEPPGLDSRLVRPSHNPCRACVCSGFSHGREEIRAMTFVGEWSPVILLCPNKAWMVLGWATIWHDRLLPTKTLQNRQRPAGGGGGGGGGSGGGGGEMVEVGGEVVVGGR
ncbi:unnamed protein product [Lampetra fluviatilis]